MNNSINTTANRIIRKDNKVESIDIFEEEYLSSELRVKIIAVGFGLGPIQ
jgi:hypothetical protein